MIEQGQVAACLFGVGIEETYRRRERKGRVKFLAKGATVVAKKKHTMLDSNDYKSVKCNVTATCTGRNTGLILAKEGMGGLRSTGRRLRHLCKIGILTMRTSIGTKTSGGTTIRRIMGRTIRRFKEVSILVGGTRTSTSKMALTSRAARRFSLTVCSKLCTAFCCVRTYCPCLGRARKSMVGFTSKTNLFNGCKRYTCTTTGRNIEKLAEMTTAR